VRTEFISYLAVESVQDAAGGWSTFFHLSSGGTRHTRPSTGLSRVRSVRSPFAQRAGQVATPNTRGRASQRSRGTLRQRRENATIADYVPPRSRPTSAPAPTPMPPCFFQRPSNDIVNYGCGSAPKRLWTYNFLPAGLPANDQSRWRGVRRGAGIDSRDVSISSNGQPSPMPRPSLTHPPYKRNPV